jgi:hypothetical protein
MRINGFEQIKAFYSIVFNQEYDFKPQHISLYVFLINQNNRNNWVEWFKCPFDLGMAGSCITNKRTYYKTLNNLQEWGLLQYEKGENAWKSPKIKLEVLKYTTTDTASVPQSEPLLPPVLPQVEPPVLPPIYKPITSNLKPKTDIPIPEYYEFLEYAKTLKPYKLELDFAIEAKYDTWVSDGWKNGNGKKINNWKNTLRNTITFLKPVFETKKTQTSTYGD